MKKRFKYLLTYSLLIFSTLQLEYHESQYCSMSHLVTNMALENYIFAFYSLS